MLFPFSRRDFLMAGAAAAIAWPKGLSATPGCTLTAEQEEGPFYAPGGAVRRDITEGKPGLPLTLRVALVDAKTCRPLPNAALDIWHCDALGAYSAFAEGAQGGPGGGRPPGPFPGGPPPRGMMGPPPGGGPGGPGRTLTKTRFLRGIQLSDARGMVEFETVYPGWYSGRAIHIHTKVHLGGDAAEARYPGGHVAHTGQLFFPEQLNLEIARLAPYARHVNVERTTESEDHVFTEEQGSAGMMRLTRRNPRSNEDGFVATVTVAVNPDATPAGVGFGPRGPGGSV
jgi:protocatechuate 3,4-dioxygenase beta subunit